MDRLRSENQKHIMPTYQKADSSIAMLAIKLMKQFDDHEPLDAAKVKIDYVFAFGDVNEAGETVGDAITKNGFRAFGVTKVMPLKDRAMGRGDVEIMLDGDNWRTSNADEQAALLDHELHHISVKADRAGNIQFDDLGRPLIKLRKHDIEVGWFSLIASRHGTASIERQQAKSIMDGKGQFYWPGIAPTIELISNGKSAGPMPMDTFAKVAAANA